jgi:hypothetical protein
MEVFHSRWACLIQRKRSDQERCQRSAEEQLVPRPNLHRRRRRPPLRPHRCSHSKLHALWALAYRSIYPVLTPQLDVQLAAPGTLPVARLLSSKAQMKTCTVHPHYSLRNLRSLRRAGEKCALEVEVEVEVNPSVNFSQNLRSPRTSELLMRLHCHHKTAHVEFPGGQLQPFVVCWQRRFVTNLKVPGWAG